MRLAPALVLTALAATGAHAADYLRGPISSEPPRAQQSTTMDWSGFYVGGEASFLNAYVDQRALASRTASAAFPVSGAASVSGQLLQFGKPHAMGKGFGGYVGYNTQWDDVVLGLELNYNRAGVTATSESASLSRLLTDTSNTGATARYWNTTLGGRATSRLTDITAFKARVGASYDRFLPFVSAGVVVGRIGTTASSTGSTQHLEQQPVYNGTTIVDYTWIPLSNVIPGSSSTKDEGWRWGYQVGAGMDVALTENIFVRGAWDYTQLGTSGARTTINAFKGGAGVKF